MLVHVHPLRQKFLSFTNVHHSLGTLPAPEVTNSTLPHNQNSCQLHIHCHRIHWKRICCLCFCFFNCLQLPRQGVGLQAHPLHPFCLRTDSVWYQPNICVTSKPFEIDACQTFLAKASTCTARQTHNKALFRTCLSTLCFLCQTPKRAPRRAPMQNSHHMLQMWLPLSQRLSFQIPHGGQQLCFIQ